MASTKSSSTLFGFINEQSILYCAISLFILACFRGCLLRIPYATILSTLVSTFGLVAGFSALFDATSITEQLLRDLFYKPYSTITILNQLKVIYIFVVLFIIIVIVFNLVVGYVATDPSPYYRQPRTPPTITATNRFCCCCLSSSARNFLRALLLRTFFSFNYLIYYSLFALTILSFIGLFITNLLHQMCVHSRIKTPASDIVVVNPSDVSFNSQVRELDEAVSSSLDLSQYGSLMGLSENDTALMNFQTDRYQKFCLEYVDKLDFLLILSSIGLVLACAGFVNYLINFGINTIKIHTRHKNNDKTYLETELQQR